MPSPATTHPDAHLFVAWHCFTCWLACGLARAPLGGAAGLLGQSAAIVGHKENLPDSHLQIC